MIDPSTRAILRSKYAIRRFFGFFLIALIAVLLLLFASTFLVCVPFLRMISTEFLSNLAAAIAVLILTYAFYVYVTPPGLRDAQVIPLHSGEISESIIDRLVSASDYWFWGRSGTYFRLEVLPKLDKFANDSGRHIQIRVVIPNPTPNNAEEYRRIKQRLGEEANVNTLAANVIATVYAIVTRMTTNQYLKAEIALCATMPALRYDISSTAALITRDRKTLPALLCNAGNPYFDMFRDAVENELRQGLRLGWDATKLASTSSAPEDLEADILRIIRSVSGFPKIEDAWVSAAAELIRNATHRYA